MINFVFMSFYLIDMVQYYLAGPHQKMGQMPHFLQGGSGVVVDNCNIFKQMVSKPYEYFKNHIDTTLFHAHGILPRQCRIATNG